jgi:hypothetical protein
MTEKSSLFKKRQGHNLFSDEYVRRELRKQARKASFLLRGRDFIKSTLLDASLHGVGLETEKCFHVNERVELLITHEEESVFITITVDLIIKHCNKKGPHKYRIGASVLDPSNSFIKVLELGQTSDQAITTSVIRRKN